MKEEFWSFIHNAVAHPVMAVANALNSLAEAFHDWSADKME